MSSQFTRREFFRELIEKAAVLGLLPQALALERWLGMTPAQAATQKLAPPKPALFYEKMAQKRIRCLICPKFCTVGDRERGFCGVKENRGGTYYSLVYGNTCFLNPDPVEQLPLYHFMPGARTLTLGTAGCNLDCKYCQNWEMSQSRPEDVKSFQVSPAEAVAQARKYQYPVVAFSYTEPTVFYEYMLDISRLAKENGLKTACVTAGLINPEPLRKACQYLDAVKIDLKAYNESFYRDYCKGSLAPVLESIETVKKTGTWLEIVYLVVPGLNDSLTEIKAMSKWLKTNIGTDVPLHFSRFFPAYKLENLPKTPYKTLQACRNVAREVGLKYVYIGNIPGLTEQNTVCPPCGKTVIQRLGYEVRKNVLKRGVCPYCGLKIPGVWG